MKNVLILSSVIALALILNNRFRITVPVGKTSISKTQGVQDANTKKQTGIIAGNLQIPWSLVFLPDGNALFTERAGRIRLLRTDDTVSEPILTLKDVRHTGEGGLLGIAIHPDFSKNYFVYLYYTYSGDDKRTLNKVVRYIYKNNRLTEDKIIVSAIPGSSNHNGGRIKFGPDKFLYITTGDSQNLSLAQNKSSLAGKILRVTDSGKPAPGNPFGTLIYSFGHRNPQGLAWDENGDLWATEHGPSARDELNQIRSGQNYGWPTIAGDQVRSGMVTPVINSGSGTWAPSGLVYIKPYLYFAGLRGTALFRFHPQTKELKQFFKGDYGRLRDVILGPDGYLYLTTSNMDGRGITHLDGDKIIRLDPTTLDL